MLIIYSKNIVASTNYRSKLISLKPIRPLNVHLTRFWMMHIFPLARVPPVICWKLPLHPTSASRAALILLLILVFLIPVKIVAMILVCTRFFLQNFSKPCSWYVTNVRLFSVGALLVRCTIMRRTNSISKELRSCDWNVFAWAKLLIASFKTELCMRLYHCPVTDFVSLKMNLVQLTLVDTLVA